jgi:putative nucleotidyltransferase with HDIG domain
MSTAPLAELAGMTDAGWLVGGAVRDQLLGRETTDFDIAVSADARGLARELGRRAGGHTFALSEAFGAWRVLAHDRSWQIDLTPLTGATLEEDLARRDLTINALARPLGSDRLIDLHGGVADLEARRLRMVGPESFPADPLRTIRLARIATELGFAVEPATAASAAASAPGLAAVAPERVFAELRLILGGESAPDGLRMMDRIGVTAIVLPELAALQGVEQSDFHHLDVHDHTLAVLEQAIELERDPAALFGPIGEQLGAVLGEPLANELTRGQALRFAAVLHDIAKPVTREVTDEGRVTFVGHDDAGAELAAAILTRLRASERLIEYVAALARHHLRLGFLVHEAPLSPRALYRYLRTCDPVAVDVTLLSVADRLATRGRKSEPAIARHLVLARAVLPAALRWRAQPPRPPIRGDRLAQALQIRPGPALGRLLEQLTEAAYAGEIEGEQQALQRARELTGVAGGPPGADR